MGDKVWKVRKVDEEAVIRLAKSAGISKLLAKVFVSRDIIDSEYVKDFLEPDIRKLHNPFLMDGMERAADRILRAVERGEGILIFGDYDVDGVASSSILYDYLTGLGAKVRYFVPDRMTEGYGLTMPAVERLERKAVEWRESDGFDLKLIITVDCGITSVEEAEHIQALGIDIIITDHHECKEVLPKAWSVLNPHKPGCPYPFKDLAGAGVALKLVHALGIKTGNNDAYRAYLDLAALATVADVVPLLGENRIIVKNGLKAIENTKNIGLGALLRFSGFYGRNLTATNIAFGIAPRINAAGRMGDALRGIRLLTEKNLAVCEALARELDIENRTRQELEDRIVEEAMEQAKELAYTYRHKVLVVSGSGWHQGIIGIVASKLLQSYNRPCIVISVEDGTGKGSGRSLECFNIFRALDYCSGVLTRFGGHEMAAGLTIEEDKIGEFRTLINKYADEVFTDEDLLPTIRIDAILERDDITRQNIIELEKLEPFGVGNPVPVFGYSGPLLKSVRTLSDGKHLKLNLWDKGLYVDAIGFNMGKAAEKLAVGDTVSVASSLSINKWNGYENIQLVLSDIRHC